MADKKALDKKKRIAQIKKGIFILIAILILIRINKTAFFLVIFSIGAFAGKIIRGQFGLSMIVLDPLMFFCILTVKFLGIKALIIFLFFNVFVADIVSNIFSPGSFLNYVLYHVCPIVGVTLFGSLSMMIYGNAASLLYSILYGIFRSTILKDDPIKVVSKLITSFVFTFLYITFFGGLFQIVMT